MTELVDLVRFVAEQTIRFMPWFLLAVALGALLQGITLDGLAKRAFSHGVVGIVLSTAVGAFSPFCSFTVIPVIRGFLKAGVPVSVAMAFWFASPTMDPEIFALTAGILGLPIAVARLLAALTLSIGAGLVVLVLERRGMVHNPLREDGEEPEPERRQALVVPGSAPPPIAGGSDGGPTGAACGGAAPPQPAGCGAAPAAAATPCGSPILTPPAGQPWWRTLAWELRHMDPRRFLRTMLRDTLSLGRWLVLAFVLQGLIVFHVPQELVLQSLGLGGLLSVPLAGALGVPLYLNGVSAIPVVAGLLDQGMQPGAAVTFLISGAVTTLPAIAAVRGVVNNRITALYLLLGFTGSVGVGLVSVLFL